MLLLLCCLLCCIEVRYSCKRLVNIIKSDLNYLRYSVQCLRQFSEERLELLSVSKTNIYTTTPNVYLNLLLKSVWVFTRKYSIELLMKCCSHSHSLHIRMKWTISFHKYKCNFSYDLLACDMIKYLEQQLFFRSWLQIWQFLLSNKNLKDYYFKVCVFYL
jgi:hypothetical protein